MSVDKTGGDARRTALHTLDRLVGTWATDGDSTGTSRYEWFEGDAFLVQHVGSGTYVPTVRAIAAGSYGAVPASTPIGPEGGRELADRTVELINALW